MKKLLLIALLFTGCKEVTITNDHRDYFEGVCKYKWVDQDLNYIGQQTLQHRLDSNIQDHLNFIDSCNNVGGYYVPDNDSNGVMCYTCQMQKWFPN